MILLRCPKFLRCLTADAGNFDRGHSLTSLPLPLAALSSLPTSARRPRTSYKNPCHCEGAPRPWQSASPVPFSTQKKRTPRHPLFYTIESLENYFSSTLAPTSSSSFFMFSASSLDRASFRVVGVSSTAFLASARPRPVISRTDLMTLIF